MLKPRICLLIGAYIIISALEVLGHPQKKCADIDEYCQTHSDCCSNSCLTYLYRCTRSYNGVYPYTFFGEKYPATGTLDDVMAFTFSNFGSVEEMKRHQQTQQTQHRPRGFDQRFGDTDIGNANYMNDEAGVSEVTTPVSTKDAVSTSQQTQQETVNNGNNNNSDNLAEETKFSSAAADCKEIGAKCFNHDECCSKRCHGFLHQCVT